MKLIIVESPSKCSTIKKYLGDGWDVAASFGHIRDLKKKELSIDKKNGYRMEYVISDDKKNVVANLKKKVSTCGKDNVYLATDEDREGEAISFHLCSVLGLNPETAKRITFKEITEPVVKQSVISPRLIDMQLVNAQETRRAIDRLVGFEVSPVLWRKIESGLSAGRVQSVAVRLVVDREKEILNFKDKFNYQVWGYFNTSFNEILKAKRSKSFNDLNDVKLYLENAKGKTYTVTDIQKKPVEKKPPSAFSTSLLQQAGVKKLNFTVKHVQDVAQKLFEAGHITYMRTDNVNLGDTAISQAKQQIISSYGESYFYERKYKNKEGAQEAHEAIRPTHWDVRNAGNTDDEKRLYELIYTRSLASQMSSAQFNETTIKIESNLQNDAFITSTKILSFEGFLKAYQDDEEDDDKEENTTLKNPVLLNDLLSQSRLEASQVFSNPPKRYNQATIVEELESKQIGRPATFASIISTIFARNYVLTGDVLGKKINVLTLQLKDGIITEKGTQKSIGADKKKILPTEIGIKVCEFLENNFADFMDYKFTANCEEELDKIANGKYSFDDFVPKFDAKLMHNVDRVNSNFKDATEKSSIQIGEYEGNLILAASGKFGTYLKYKDENFDAKDFKPEGISLEKAIEIIKLKTEGKKRDLGKYLGKEFSVGKGQYGTYVVWDKQYFNVLGKEPADILNTDALAIIKEGLEKKAKQKEEGDKSLLLKIKKYEIRSGQFGLYVTDGETKASLPKSVTEDEAKKWDEAKCKEQIKNYKDWKKKSGKEIVV